LTPDWLLRGEDSSEIRCATVVRTSDTRWITDPSVLGASRDLPADRFQTVDKLPESFAADAKRAKQRTLEARIARMRRNEARVLAAAHTEDQTSKELEERHLNGLRSQRLSYLQAIAMRSD
jgi:hypothetical protein